MKKINIFILFCVTSISLVYGIGDESLESKLYTDLFRNYNRKLRPIKGQDYNQQITVSVLFTVSHIESLNEKSQVLRSHGGIRLIWKDGLLHWNASEYGGASSLVLQAGDVWLPEIALLNSVSDISELAFEYVESRVIVLSDGTVAWIPAYHFESTCAVDVTNFPYDTQTCSLYLLNWMYTSALVNFNVSSAVGLDSVIPSLGWNITDAYADIRTTSFDGIEYPIVQVDLTIKRNPTYFELNIFVPATLLSFLLILMFLLPVDSGEKVSLGVTLMLAYSIFLLMLTEYTPQSGSTPKLSIALLLSIVFAGVGLLCNVIIINIHHHLPEKRVPNLVRKIFLARWFCRKADEVVELEDKTKPQNESKMHKSEWNESHVIQDFQKKQQDDDSIERNKEEWNRLARALDRVFFWLYLIYFVGFMFSVLSIKWSNS